jgi:hypothetical protein
MLSSFSCILGERAGWGLTAVAAIVLIRSHVCSTASKTSRHATRRPERCRPTRLRKNSPAELRRRLAISVRGQSGRDENGMMGEAGSSAGQAARSAKVVRRELCLSHRRLPACSMPSSRPTVAAAALDRARCTVGIYRMPRRTPSVEARHPGEHDQTGAARHRSQHGTLPTSDWVRLAASSPSSPHPFCTAHSRSPGVFVARVRSDWLMRSLAAHARACYNTISGLGCVSH